MRTRLFLILCVALAAGCDGHRPPMAAPDCITGAVCDTGNPCNTARVRCDTANRPHCMVVDVLPNCPPRPSDLCIAGSV